MMGFQQPQKELFTYQINLDKRVRPDHPLRRIHEAVDFSFVRAEVAHLYGHNGNESVDPAVILKMLFLLFFDNVASERELMRIIPERLDYLWFLGYELDAPIPDPSVLSKARARWGRAAFEKFFVRTVGQCVAAGLVEGGKIHVDSSLNDADAAVVRRASQPPRPRYQNHRAIDDAHGVITAVETTSGSVAENHRLLPLIDQHETNTGQKVATAVGDHKYGTSENFVACAQRDIRARLGDLRAKQHHARSEGIFPDSAFRYDPASNTVRCPAGQTMRPRRLHPQKRAWEYQLPKAVCAACELRAQCTRAVCYGRTMHRHEHQALLDQARAQAHSAVGQRDRRRRQHLAEGSFADAANNHGFKRARWRRLWRVQIQDWLIAGIQNIKILLRTTRRLPAAAQAVLRRVQRDHLWLGGGSQIRAWHPTGGDRWHSGIRTNETAFAC